jgi:hypothetical protein
MCPNGTYMRGGKCYTLADNIPVQQSSSLSFDSVLSRYRTTMADYIATGNIGSKTAADGAKAWILMNLRHEESKNTTNSNFINKFVSEYPQFNTELVSAQNTLKKVKTQGPRLENVYMTDKEAADAPERDFMPYYIKAGVILGVGALVVMLL